LVLTSLLGRVKEAKEEPATSRPARQVGVVRMEVVDGGDRQSSSQRSSLGKKVRRSAKREWGGDGFGRSA
jgi:hypothetical protein